MVKLVNCNMNAIDLLTRLVYNYEFYIKIRNYFDLFEKIYKYIWLESCILELILRIDSKSYIK